MGIVLSVGAGVEEMPIRRGEGGVERMGGPLWTLSGGQCGPCSVWASFAVALEWSSVIYLSMHQKVIRRQAFDRL